jgi:hypothetical protein
MTPPKTVPEKRPDRHYDFGRLNMWFALSALGLLATTLWMVFADASSGSSSPPTPRPSATASTRPR